MNLFSLLMLREVERSYGSCGIARMGCSKWGVGDKHWYKNARN